MKERTLWLHIEQSTDTLAELVDRLDTFSVAEVDTLEHGYELGIYLDLLADEDRLDPAEMFGCVYRLLTELDGSAELTFEHQTVTSDDMLDLVAQLAKAAGYAIEQLTRAERFFLEHSALSWPCSIAALKQHWKLLAARFHPDQEGDAAQFRLAKEGYEGLKRRL